MLSTFLSTWNSTFHGCIPIALDISLNMHVECCIVKSRERLARALLSLINDILFLKFFESQPALFLKLFLFLA